MRESVKEELLYPVPRYVTELSEGPALESTIYRGDREEMQSIITRHSEIAAERNLTEVKSWTEVR